ncbi:ectopic P-granules autophagy protein 5 isoform X2 [Rhodnius prolixus]|uniref:ectopic P-granules autophagy protein 5 isoform X2 n=1 Tax=Rhodnius prolixus TaxID=13249 RepID=UPI003D18DC87
MEACKTKSKKKRVVKQKSPEDESTPLNGQDIISNRIEDEEDLKFSNNIRTADGNYKPEEIESLLNDSETCLEDLSTEINLSLDDTINSNIGEGTIYAHELEEIGAGANVALAPPLEKVTHCASFNLNPIVTEAGGEYNIDVLEYDVIREDELENRISHSFSELSIDENEDDFAEMANHLSKFQEVSAFTESQLLSIYHNEELSLNSSFIDQFIDVELRSGSVQRHPLYDLLISYLKSREKQATNSTEIDTLLNECKEIQQRLWIIENVKVTETGECQDGNPVEASHEYQIGMFDQIVLSKLATQLALVREMANEQHSLYSYSCQVIKLKVDNFINAISQKFSNLPHNAPVTLLSDSVARRTSELCGAISVLFYFQRLPCKDQGFITETRQWLTQLIAILLRVSTWSEHMFLLNHILRCPAGIFKWAISYVQCPIAPFRTPNPVMYLNHMVTAIATIVCPIKERQAFLSQMDKSLNENDDVWVMVDSDGEDEEDSPSSQSQLRENDIIAMLNQVPLDALFRQILQLSRRDDVDIYNALSSGEMLKVFAMSKLLIKILEQGIRTYGSTKYQQFAKRLARVISDTVHYVNDCWEIFKKDNNELNDPNIERLQVEYNNIIISACTAFLGKHHKSILQYLMYMPFTQISLLSLWKLLNMVMQPYKSEWWMGVEELVPNLSDAELYYLLTTVSNMALARPSTDWVFIKVITTHLLQIGIVNTSTRDMCYKTARTLLSNLTNKYPPLISVMLNKLKHLLPQAGNLSIYLFKELPLHLWKPTKEDLNLVEHWLLACPNGSMEGALARFILNHMNWGLNPNLSGELFLKREVHCQVALLVVRLAILHCPEAINSNNSMAISDTVKLMSQLKGPTGRSIPEQSLSIWVWTMLFKLRLHLLDQPEPFIWATLANPMQYFSILPSLESLPNELSPLVRALKENQVTAIFTALLMTSTGHSVPLICHTGFQMLLVLLQSHRYLAVLDLLEHIVPLFLDCPGSLLASEKFQQVLTGLLIADRTFLKFAVSLLSTDFPGLILKQFGDLIQVHIENYRKYNLSSPAPVIELWLRILSKIWVTEPVATSYLMDILLQAAFFRTEIKSMACEILCELYEQTIEASQREVLANNKSKFSLVSWVTGSAPTGLLLPKSAQDTPWFTYFALEIEQQKLFTINGLWKQLVLDLSTSSGKTNIDATIKKSCSTLKLASIPSSNIPIYRWSQQALDTPVDHPALPLFWQRFFMLYLSRIPSTSRKDLGSVGAKFFEGVTKHSYLKKLKKKLNDCKTFFEAKCNNTAQVVTPEKKQWFDNLAKLYTTYCLWLEEPTLHEPGVYVPALPVPYNGKKLLSVFNGDEELWYEYIDYDTVRASQRQSLLNWEQSLFRLQDITVKPLPSPTESDCFTRISKRLQRYESPVPPPSLRPLQHLVPDTPPEALYNKFLMLEILKDSFKALTSYAQVYSLRRGEHSSIDCCLLELVSLLYRTVETQVTLHAACDTHNPGCNHVPSVSSLNCAGPAVIHIKVCAVHVNDAVDMAIHNNRIEVQNLLKRSLQPPPVAVTMGSVHIEQTVRALEEKCSDLRRIGDVQLLNNIQDVGVALFYHMTYLFTEEAASYPPLKQLITTCVETLGQCFISCDEKQGPVLLTRLLETPSLSSLLGTHFSPTKSSPQLYIQLYRTLMNAVIPSNYDLIFVLLTKFEMGLWMESQKPRLSERSQLIELVGQALSSAGQSPPQDYIMIHEVLRRQLCVLMMHDAPQHYNQVISVALKHSESHSLAAEVWYDIVNALVWQSGVQFKPHTALAQVVSDMTKFAVDQNVFSQHEVIEVANLLGGHFTEERLQYGLYGLYPKYRIYVSPFATILGVVSHALISTTIKKHSGLNSAKICDEVWPYFNGLYSPWISPYFTQSLAQPTAAWIQQLTDDRSILLPWISPDSGHAHKIAAIFTESIRFLLESLPGSGDILSHVWQYYVTNFAHISVKEHVLSVIHSNLLSLPWNRFSPSLPDLDLMHRVSDTYVPYCHNLLGAIFIDIPWQSWMETIPDLHQLPKVLCSLLHLLVKLANEPNVRQSGKIVELLKTSCNFHWELVDCSNYESVVNWFVMSYDPRVILNLEEDSNEIDNSVLGLLRFAAGFVSEASGYHSSTPRKRQLYVRACVKLVISCLSKHKSLVMANQTKVQTAIEEMLSLINTVVPLSGGSHAEAGLHVSEVLALVNLRSNPLGSLSTNIITSWVAARGDCVVSGALLRTLGTTVEHHVPLGQIMEAVLTAVFTDRSTSDWENVKSQLQEPVPRQLPIEDVLVSNSQVLSLYALITKSAYNQIDLDDKIRMFNNLTTWISSIKQTEECESKMVLMFHLGLVMASWICDDDPSICDRNLRLLAEAADNWADHRTPWAFLGAIGFKKNTTLSNRCRTLARVLSALILCQLPERKGELPVDQPPFIRTTPHAPGGLTSNNMELGPSSDAVKALSNLENLMNEKGYTSCKHAVEMALGLIRLTENSMHNAHKIYLKLAKLLYPEVRFIQSINSGS